MRALPALLVEFLDFGFAASHGLSAFQIDKFFVNLPAVGELKEGIAAG
jgi:hypothetical protein